MPSPVPIVSGPSAVNSRRLTELREQAGLSQLALAQRAGLNQGAYWRIEAGQRGCTADTLRKIADVLAADLSVSVGQVLTELTDA